MNKELVRPYVRRFAIIFVFSVIAVFFLSEVAFKLQKNNIDRGPQEIELVIPAGTAEKVAAGQPVPGIPEEMVFIVGDKLIVRNQDNVTHELGPVLVPPGASASLPMDNADSFALNCSFQTNNYLGLDVKEATTWKTRLTGVGFAAPATTLMIFLYSIAIKPIEPPEDKSEAED